MVTHNNLFEVAITGIGCFSSIGKNEVESIDSLKTGYCGIQASDNVNYGRRVLGEIRDLDLMSDFDPQERRPFFRNGLLNILIARSAVNNSGLDFGLLNPYDSIVISGSQSSYGVDEEVFFKNYFSDSSQRVHPLTLIQFMRGGMVHQICKENKIHGSGYVLDSACASGLHALGEAFYQIQSGRAKYAIAGCAETPFGETHLKAWEAIGALSKKKCQPFDIHRSGTILGEGGSYFVLERADLARMRGARVYGYIESFVSTRDAYDLTKPHLKNITYTMKRAIELSGVSPSEIQHISAHGSGTQLNDSNEVNAIKEVFGSHAKNLSISATKSMHGHLEFATGNVELALVLMAQQNGLLPPIVNLDDPDPEFELDFITQVARHKHVTRIMKNSFGFGGANATMVIRIPV